MKLKARLKKLETLRTAASVPLSGVHIIGRDYVACDSGKMPLEEWRSLVLTGREMTLISLPDNGRS